LKKEEFFISNLKLSLVTEAFIFLAHFLMYEEETSFILETIRDTFDGEVIFSFEVFWSGSFYGDLVSGARKRTRHR
jgi:hypothetical protein